MVEGDTWEEAGVKADKQYVEFKKNKGKAVTADATADDAAAVSSSSKS